MNDTKIELEYEGKNYTLEYNKASVKLLEAKGFKFEEFTEKPMTNIELVFQGAFLKNHPSIKLELVEEIFAHCGDKNDLIGILSKMIAETYEDLLGNKNVDDSKKAIWKTVDLTPKETKN